jgi:type I restriction enzyme M protein
MNTNEIVQKLWNLCNILKDDGITYHQYVGELTQLLFLKMARETGTEERIPEALRWDSLLSTDGIEQFRHYKHCLLELGECEDSLIAAIYDNAVTHIREPRHLSQLIADIDQLDWFAEQHERDDLGDMYEGLLEKNASETKSGAGQYFTPRVLIDSIVSLVQPQLGEVIQDPAAGTSGFLIAAGRYLRKHHNNFDNLTDAGYRFQQQRALVGMELVPETRRLALMNCFLHDLGGREAEIIKLGNTLSNEVGRLAKPTSCCRTRHLAPKKAVACRRATTLRSRPVTSNWFSSNTSTGRSCLAVAQRSCCPITCCLRPVPAPMFAAT